MPVRSLGSSVLRWPNREAVAAALESWLAEEAKRHPELLRLGYFGSYARGHWGVGSDLDLVAIVSASAQPFERRALPWSTEDLPVPTELLVYTEAEWEAIRKEEGRFATTLERETIWVWPK
jgi:uncharacterized protein